MFSIGVREMLRERTGNRLIDRLRGLLYTELRVPALR